LGACALPFQIVTIIGFIAGLAITLAASELLARGLTRLGTKMGFSEGLVGLLAALGADSPELSSAIVAILAGAGTVGVGVIVGSNLFNLAALLGLSALLAGGVRIRRGPLLLDAAVGLFVLGAAGLMVAGAVSPVAAALVVIPVTVVYVVILAVPRHTLRRFRLLVTGVPHNLAEIPYEPGHDLPPARHGSWAPVLLLPIALGGVVGGSFVMVHEALAAQRSLHLSDAVLGSLVLAALTSLPNLWVALHFARRHRGTALFSSAMNSNSINLLGGLMIPALFFGLAAARGSLPYLTWLVALTLLVVLAPLPHSRLSRVAGALIIGIYLVYAALRVFGV
jgi:cation:H+ antiporter